MRFDRRLTALLMLSLVAGLACAFTPPGAIVAPYASFERIATLEDRQINEASGLVASLRHDGVFYVNNDSGDAARVFAIDRRGRTLATITLAGATHVDFEDIARAPGDDPNTFDLVVADIGDNRHQRQTLTLYRFAEPTITPGGGSEITVRPRVTQIRYAGGPVDAEALFVCPRTGDGYIITKRRDGKPADVYRLLAPWPTDAVATLERVAELKLVGGTPYERFVTAADISPDGRRLVVRTYLGGWEWSADAPTDVVKLLATEPRWLQLAPEPQGEAIAYAADGAALITLSEQLPTYLHEVRRKDVAAR